MRSLRRRPPEEAARAWARTRQAGMAAYVLRVGLLGFGVGMGSLWLFIMWLSISDFDIATYGGAALRAFALGGLCWGLALWSLHELRYKRTMRLSTPRTEAQRRTARD